jgi:glycosyltransferase involved in cell wall biosynthesis
MVIMAIPYGQSLCFNPGSTAMGKLSMRLLVVANLPPYVLGGAESQVARLIEAWIDFGHHIEVAGHRIPNGIMRIGRSEIRTHRITVIDRAGRAGRAATYFVSMLRLLLRTKRNFDLIYCRGLGDAAVSICVLKAIGAVRLPLVACPINARGAGDSSFLRSIPGWRLLLRLINRHCNAINIIAPAILSDLHELGIDRPGITHIPNGIKIVEPIRRSQPEPIRRMIWTGRLVAQKGIDILLKALANVVAAGGDFRLEMIGDGPDKAMLLTQCHRLGLEKRVRFTQAMAKEAVRAALADADVFVLPSRYEGMSNSALEAMEAGLPVLLTSCGGIDTYIDEKTGWLCVPDDVGDLTAALLRMLDTPGDKIVAMGKNARQMVERHFQIEMIAQKNAELFKQLIGSSLH